MKRKFKKKTIKIMGKKVTLKTSPYSVLATLVDDTGKILTGFGRFPSDAIRELKRKIK